MDKDFLNKMRKKLLAQRKRLEQNLKKIADFDPKVKNRIDFDAVMPDFGSEEDDNAQEVTNYNTRVGLERKLEKKLNDIEGALKRIKNGTYGKCIKCKGEIPQKRLEAFPEAKYCLKCQE